MTGQTVTGAVAKRDQGAAAVITRYRADFAGVLPSHIKPETFLRLAQGVLRRNEKIAKIADKNPASLVAVLLDCARLGHEPDTDAYYLIPFGNEIQGIEGYQGQIERMYRAGAVVSVKAEVVKAGDLSRDEHGRPRFEWIPSEMDRPHHKPDLFSDRGELIGTYAYAEMVDGSTSRVAFLNRSEVMEHKAMSKASKGPDSPWVKWEDSMWLKTGVRELEKWVPTSSEYRREQLRAAAEASHVAAAVAPVNAPPGPPAYFMDAEVVDEPPRQEHRAEPAPEPPAPAVPMATQAQLTKLHTTLGEFGVTKSADKLRDVSLFVRRELESSKDLTKAEAITVIDALETLAKNEDKARALDAYLAELELADQAAVDGA